MPITTNTPTSLEELFPTGEGDAWVEIKRTREAEIQRKVQAAQAKREARQALEQRAKTLGYTLEELTAAINEDSH